MSPPIFNFAKTHPHRISIQEEDQSYTYGNLLNAAEAFAHVLLQNEADLAERRVAFMVKPGFDYVRTQWGIWLAGGVVVPLCITYPLPSLQYVLEDTHADIVVVSPEFEAVLGGYCRKKGLHLIVLGKEEPEAKEFYPRSK